MERTLVYSVRRPSGLVPPQQGRCALDGSRFLLLVHILEWQHNALGNVSMWGLQINFIE